MCFGRWVFKSQDCFFYTSTHTLTIATPMNVTHSTGAITELWIVEMFNCNIDSK